MTERVLNETRTKLDHVPERLSDEFADVSAAAVERDVSQVAKVLLERARFTDFVPLLTHRIVREALLEEGHEQIRRAAVNS